MPPGSSSFPRSLVGLQHVSLSDVAALPLLERSGCMFSSYDSISNRQMRVTETSGADIHFYQSPCCCPVWLNALTELMHAV